MAKQANRLPREVPPTTPASNAAPAVTVAGTDAAATGSEPVEQGARQRFPTVAAFSDKKREYRAWKFNMLAKLRADGDAIEPPSAQFTMFLVA